VRHINRGELRRFLDEPFALGSSRAEHLAHCPVCSGRLEEVKRDRDIVAQILGHRPSYAGDIVGARARLEAASGQNVRRTRPGWNISDLRPRKLWRLSPVPMAAVIAAVVAFTPAGALANNVLSVFQPQQLTTLAVTPGELRSLPDLRNYGSLHIPSNVQPETLNSLKAAEAAAHEHLLVPAHLPASVPHSRFFQVLPAQHSSFTFSASKAANYAAKHHSRLKGMPKAINGSTIRLKTGLAVITVYGPAHALPSLVVGQAAAPTVTSSGAGLARIERYLLHLPGVSPQLARQIEAIGKPATTLPIPVPVNLAYSHSVRVNGAPGVLIGDNTGVASVVIWEQHREIYGVAGQLTATQVLSIANSLH